MKKIDSAETKRVYLTLDLGNTTLRGGIWRDGSLLSDWIIDAISPDFFHVLEKKLGSIGEQGGIDFVILSSVVPDRNSRVRRVVRDCFHRECYSLTFETPTGMTIKYDRPEQIGADRIANSVGAYLTYGGPVIAVDFGTAITFDVVSGDFEYLGGVIAPGLEISTSTLFQKAALLPRVKISLPDGVLGRTTEDAIRSGVFWGTVGLVEEIIRRLRDELGWGDETRFVATGGHSRLLLAQSRLIQTIDPDLTLRGLYLIARKITPLTRFIHKSG